MHRVLATSVRLLTTAALILAASPATPASGADGHSLTVRLWEGGAAVVPLSEINGLRSLRLTNGPSRGKLYLAGAALEAGALIALPQDAEEPLIYRHADTGGSLSADHAVFEAVAGSGSGSLDLRIEVNASPVSELPGLVLWLDAAAPTVSSDVAGTVAASGGGSVACWRDRSGAGNDACQGEEMFRPTLSPSEGPARPRAIRLDGSGSHLVSPATLPSAELLDGYTYVAAFRPEAGGAPFQGVIAANGARSGLFVSGDHVLSRRYREDNPNAWLSARAGLDAWLAAFAVYDGSNVVDNELYVNGRLVASAAGKPQVREVAKTSIGDTESGLDFALRGEVGELILLDRAILPAERMAIDLALRSKWTGAVIYDVTDRPGGGEVTASSRYDGILLGGPEADRLVGGGAADVLDGGGGDDQLTGGGGADTFVFRRADGGRVTVTDYVPPADLLDFSPLLSESRAGFEDHFRIRAVGSGIELLVDRDGAAGFDAPDLVVSLPGRNALSAAELRTGVRTALAGASSLRILVEGAGGKANGPVLGEPALLRLFATDAAGEEREVLGPVVDWQVTPGAARIGRDRRLIPLVPGPLSVSATYAGRERTITLFVRPPVKRRVVELGRISLGVGDGAVQGLVHHDDSWYVSSNVKRLPTWVEGTLHRFTSDFRLLQRATIRPAGFSNHVHIGAIDVYDGSIWATMMDSATLTDPDVEPRVGLARIDADSLQLVAFHDLSESFRRLDAIAFEKDAVWLPTNPIRLVRLPMTPAGPDASRLRSYSYQAGIGPLQGVRLRGPWIYAVPDAGSSGDDVTGIAVFDRRRLIEDPNVALPAAEHARGANVPAFVYPFRVPESAPYHESFEFDPWDPDLIRVPFVPGHDSLAVMRLGRHGIIGRSAGWGPLATLPGPGGDLLRRLIEVMDRVASDAESGDRRRARP